MGVGSDSDNSGQWEDGTGPRDSRGCRSHARRPRPSGAGRSGLKVTPPAGGRRALPVAQVQMRPSSATALPRGASKVTTLPGAATPLAARRPSLVEARFQAVVNAVLLTLDARSAHPADVQIPRADAVLPAPTVQALPSRMMTCACTVESEQVGHEIPDPGAEPGLLTRVAANIQRLAFRAGLARPGPLRDQVDATLLRRREAPITGAAIEKLVDREGSSPPPMAFPQG